MPYDCGCFYLEFEEQDACFSMEFVEDEHFYLCFGEIYEIDHDYDPYLGPYEVTPLAWQEQVLATKDKNMTDDVTVFEIPYDEVSNPDGTTVVIAS